MVRDEELKWTRGACLAEDLDPTALVTPGCDMESIDTILPLAGETGAFPGLPGILCCTVRTRIHFQTIVWGICYNDLPAVIVNAMELPGSRTL